MKKDNVSFLNSAGLIFYGMHFYPGVAEYAQAGKEPLRVFINENTIRKMNPTFAGRPIYVNHVSKVASHVEGVRDGDGENEAADGWVIESFFNKADGKHWAKFIIVSERAINAIRSGMRLSNAYVPRAFGQGGTWNGVTYAKEITDGEFEHLAIVEDPRYEESVIMTPEQFKAYNSEKEVELLKLANSKTEKGNEDMGFNMFKKTKVENSADFASMGVKLPKSGVEVTIAEMVEQLDTIHNMHGYANGDHMVKIGEEEMSVNELIDRHTKLNSELEELKKPKNESGDEADVDDIENESEDEAAKKKALELAAHEEKEIKEKKENEDKAAEEVKKNEAGKKKAEGKKHFESLKNANTKVTAPTVKVELSSDRVARGQARYGSN